MRINSNEIVEPPFKYRNPKGLSDILPDSQRYWQLSISILDHLSQSFGYHRVITPPIESKSLYDLAFSKDWQNQLIDAQMISNDEHYVLRAHPRVSLMRSYKENGFLHWPPPVHLAYQVNTMRKLDDAFVENYYYCFDVIGAKDATTNATLLMLLQKLACDLKLKKPVIMLHSNGCAKCRPNFDLLFKSQVHPHISDLCPRCKENPTVQNISNCELDSKAEWLVKMPQLLDNLCLSCHNQLTGVLETCDILGINYDVNPNLYTADEEAEQTIFGLKVGDEAVPSVIGFHYDNFASQLAEQPLTAIGLSFNLQQFSQFLENAHASLPDTEGIQVFIAQLGEQAKSRSIPLLQQLYNAGFSATTATESDSISQQLQIAERLRARITLIIGQKEAINGHIIMRDMVSGLQDNIYIDELLPVLQERLSA
ncbi:MAG: His/Gly/Thr/Pro-type tRNA ligase C-terminal domain-containing protein [Patescibacteria group bacterium]|jgi:histidyl-tRNA synthetase